jgi:hypothetical protein
MIRLTAPAISFNGKSAADDRSTLLQLLLHLLSALHCCACWK